ncbi:MAG: GvpL/GvpF family gas vesicle protein [Planctomycetota bacterium]
MDDVSESVPECLRRLEEVLGDEISREEAVSLLAQAKREAHADVLSLLRDMYKRVLLDAALAPAEVQVRAEGQGGADEEGVDQDELLQEVEAIRRRIAENEQFLLHGPAPSTADEGPEGEAEALPGPTPAVAMGAECESAPGGTAYYVYGVVKAEESIGLLLRAAGVSPEQPVGLVSADGLAAVVSVVSLDEFGEDELETNIKDPEWAEAKVRAHHEVLNELLSRGICPVPLQFCTIFQGLDRVHGMLREHREEFLSALGRLAEKVEWGVKMFCDQTTARRWVGEEAPTAGAPKEEMETAGAGAAYFLRKRMEKMLNEKVERVADEAAQTSHETLDRLSVDAVILTLQGRETTGRVEPMLLNGAYLVSDESFPGFKAAIDRLTQDWAPFGCSFELTGPWPAYNFARVDAAEAVNE